MPHLPTAELVVRVRNGLPLVRDALHSARAQTYPGNLTIRVLIDGGTTDKTWEAAELAAAEDVAPNHRWVIRQYPAMTLFEMTQRALQEATGDFVFWLDHDNIVSPWRVASSIGTCQRGRGLCLSPFGVVNAGERGVSTIAPPADTPFKRVYMIRSVQFADSLAQRLDMKWVRAQLLPSIQMGLDLGISRALVDDFYTALIACHYGQVCPRLHPRYAVGTYRYQDTSYSDNTNLLARSAYTLATYWRLVEDGLLGEAVDRDGVEYRGPPKNAA